MTPPDTGGGPPVKLERVELSCPNRPEGETERTQCAQRHDVTIVSTIDRFYSCTISDSSRELVMILGNSANGNNVKITVQRYAGQNNYRLDSGGFAVTGFKDGTVDQELATNNTGKCTETCDAQVTDTVAPGPGQHPVTIKVVCPSICVTHTCNICTDTGRSNVEFKYSGMCTWS